MAIAKPEHTTTIPTIADAVQSELREQVTTADPSVVTVTLAGPPPHPRNNPGR